MGLIGIADGTIKHRIRLEFFKLGLCSLLALTLDSPKFLPLAMLHSFSGAKVAKPAVVAMATAILLSVKVSARLALLPLMTLLS